ncbi:hypothetical protein [Allobranchiibius sp. GilTou73]|uniref:AfsR/SARP family transcriptional regulator n=1 Tax=Allobranchiibius sp. GilTou73 TaxID=2904523 RepID=UPI001F3A50C6|nr:hypothetical protein [Allobranchiibius sp. GilTou73]UIJ36381.1 hypothetical protein LVQ62_08480 [Allobranchiibius sp. GilTou73]
MTVYLRLLGAPRVEDGGVSEAVRPRGRKSWAVIARTALSSRAPTRSELAQEIVGDADDPAGSLRWVLADVRRVLQDPTVLRGDPVQLSRDAVHLDVWQLADDTLEPDRIGGLLLDGVEPRDCPEFSAWLAIERAHWARRSGEALRRRALQALSVGDAQRAVDVAARGASLDLFDDAAQELYLRALVEHGECTRAAEHLRRCGTTYRQQGLEIPRTLVAAARGRSAGPPSGVDAGLSARSLLRAGTAALAAGAVDGGVETLRRAVQDAGRSDDRGLQARTAGALGAALVHAVRGCDGEGAVLLHRAVVLAREMADSAVAGQALRELAFVDIQAGRHDSARRAIVEARREMGAASPAGGDPAERGDLLAGVLGLEGMNLADQGRHEDAADMLTESVQLASRAGAQRQRAWSLGLLARSLLMLEQIAAARDAAQASVDGVHLTRWNAFLPFPQTVLSECRAAEGHWDEAAYGAAEAFALAVELGDPCWEGAARRAMSLVAQHDGEYDRAWEWMLDARSRCDRVTDRYVWISCYVGAAQLQLAHGREPALGDELAARLHTDAQAADLPEFQAWALLHQAASGDPAALRTARLLAASVDTPSLQAALRAVDTSVAAREQ